MESSIPMGNTPSALARQPRRFSSSRPKLPHPYHSQQVNEGLGDPQPNLPSQCVACLIVWGRPRIPNEQVGFNQVCFFRRNPLAQRVQGKIYFHNMQTHSQLSSFFFYLGRRCTNDSAATGLKGVGRRAGVPLGDPFFCLF